MCAVEEQKKNIMSITCDMRECEMRVFMVGGVAACMVLAAMVEDAAAGNTICNTVGAQTYCSDGSVSQRIGRVAHDNKGNRWQRVGTVTYGSDGTTYNRVGTVTYDNRGNSFNQVGRYTYGSDGSSCTRIGSQTHCNSGSGDGASRLVAPGLIDTE